MAAERLGQPAPMLASPAAALRHAFACWWWVVRAHVADSHHLPRRQALEPPPADWLRGWRRCDL